MSPKPAQVPEAVLDKFIDQEITQERMRPTTTTTVTTLPFSIVQKELIDRVLAAMPPAAPADENHVWKLAEIVCLRARAPSVSRKIRGTCGVKLEEGVIQTIAAVMERSVEEDRFASVVGDDAPVGVAAEDDPAEVTHAVRDPISLFC